MDGLITKVKWEKKRIEIKYMLERADGEYDVQALSSPDEPADGFKNAWLRLSLLAAQMCEIPKTAEWARDLKVREVALKWRVLQGTSLFEARIKFEKPMKKAEKDPAWWTPWKREAEGKQDDAFVLEEKQAAVVDDVLAEAAKYLKGQRAQMTLDEAGKG